MKKRESTDTRTRLSVFTGFLGSGKTTVLRDLLTQIRHEKVGVIVNEWGDLGVDEALLRTTGVENIRELLGGQIFCSCLSGSFLSTIGSLLDLTVTTILVETSGLAKPATLRDLVGEAENRFGERIEYQGMVCVIDGERFLKLRSVVKALDEQVAYSDRFIITKADRVGPETIQRIIQALRKSKPEAEIVIRSGNPIPLHSVFKIGTGMGKSPDPYDPYWAGWGKGGRPETITILPKEPIERKGIDCFLSRMASQTFRIKGIVLAQEEKSPVWIDGVEGTVQLVPLEVDDDPIRPERMGITLIWKGPAPSRERVLQVWRECTGTEGV